MNGWGTGNVIIFTQSIDTNWHHYAISYDGQQITGWYDGVNIGTDYWYADLEQAYAGIGGWTSDREYTQQRQWYGNICQVAFWNRVLTQAQVSAQNTRLHAMVSN